MFAPDLQFIGFTATEWNRLLEAVRPLERVPLEQPTQTGGVILVTDGRKLLKFMHTERGRLEPNAEPWPEPLQDVARKHAACWAAHVQLGALQDLFDCFGDKVKREDDYLQQMLLLLGLVRRFQAEGRIRVWSQRLTHWPLPSRRAVIGALDALCPVGQSLLWGVFKQGELYTSVAARRGFAGFDRIVGPSLLRREMGLVPGDWMRDYRHLLRAAEALAGPVAVGCYGELLTFQSLAQSTRPGAWAQAVAMREVILTPSVPALAIPLGIDAGLAALQGVRALAERAKVAQWFAAGGPLASLLDRVQTAGTSRSRLESILGFDPLALIYKLVEKHPPGR